MEILIEGPLDYGEGKEWKKRYFVMKYEITSGLRYIEVYKDKNWRKQLPKHVVNLHPGYEVKRVRTDPKKKYCFSVKTTDHCVMLATDEENVMNQWLATFEEYNLVKSFCVQPQDSVTMKRIDAIFPCHLQMVHSEVRLVSAMDGSLLGLWPFKCIRRYKFTGNLFSIEAGRKAPTGEGVFEFISNECSEIYRVMDTIIRTKACDPSIQRFASHKLPSRTTIMEHQNVRRTVSHPSQKKEDFHYDYAITLGNKVKSPRLPPPIPASPPPASPPKDAPFMLGSLEETQYDTLSPTDAPSTTLESKATMDESNSYDSLLFKDNKTDEIEQGVVRSSSAGSYDTLTFTKQTISAEQGATVGDYDKLDLSKKNKSSRNNSTSSLDDSLCVSDKQESTLKSSPSDVYNTLSHVEGTETLTSAYDSLNTGQVNTYNCLQGALASSPEKQSLTADDTYNHITNAPKQPTFATNTTTAEKPIAPVRPPPRQKKGKQPKEKQPPLRLAPDRPPRQHKHPKQTSDNVDGGTVSTSPQPQSLKDVIQRKAANIKSHDDGSYATVDHEYASIDYSKVSSKPDADPVVYSEPDVISDQTYSEPSDVTVGQTYSEPNEPQSPAPVNPPKPSKPKRHPPKAIKGLFKKNPSTPPGKVKASPIEEGNFADELKRKLELKLRKGEGAKDTAILSKQPSTDNEDDIYTEVDNDGMNI